LWGRDVTFKNFGITSSVVKMERVKEKRKLRGKEMFEANPPTLSLFY
jgi:hypothetical protein